MFSTRIIAPIAAVVTLLAAVAFWNVLGPIGGAAPAIFFVAAMLLSKPKALLLSFWAVTLFIPTIEILAPPLLVKILEQTFGVALLGVLLADAVIQRKRLPGTQVMNGLVIGFLATAAISAFINRVPAMPLAFYLLTYTKHYWVFYFALRFLEPKDCRMIFRVMLVSFAVQFPFNLAYYVGLNPLPNMIWRRFVDASIGTVGACNVVGYFMLACICLLIAYGRRAALRNRVKAFVFGVVAFVQFFFTYTIHAYPLLAGAVVMQYALFRKRATGTLARIVLILGVTLLLMAALVSVGPLSHASRQIFSVDTWRYNWERMKEGPKLEAYREVLLRGSRYLNYPFLGGGPGNYTSNIAFIMNRPLAQLPHMFYRYEALDRRRVSMGGSILSMTRTGVIALWGEVGPVGFFLFWGAYVYAGWRVWRQTRNGRYHSRCRQALAEAFVPVMTVYMILNVITEMVPIHQLNLGLWIWAAAVWNGDAPEQAPERASGAAPDGARP
ncbi:MAG: hypothetical protein JW951_00800 [Lentisphaerae bacterium]|nr:hypothetical protein [Lentisphaerota bacterium]